MSAEWMRCWSWMLVWVTELKEQMVVEWTEYSSSRVSCLSGADSGRRNYLSSCIAQRATNIKLYHICLHHSPNSYPVPACLGAAISGGLSFPPLHATTSCNCSCPGRKHLGNEPISVHLRRHVGREMHPAPSAPMQPPVQESRYTGVVQSHFLGDCTVWVGCQLCLQLSIDFHCTLHFA